MINRREFLGLTVGAGATLALTPELLRALETLRTGGTLIQRAIQSTGEMLPALGLSFSNHPGCADHAVLTEILKTFADSGGRVYDAMHVSPAAEQFHITAATELGISNKLFWSTRGSPGRIQSSGRGARQLYLVFRSKQRLLTARGGAALRGATPPIRQVRDFPGEGCLPRL